jgi:hypothetical protein
MPCGEGYDSSGLCTGKPVVWAGCEREGEGAGIPSADDVGSDEGLAGCCGGDVVDSSEPEALRRDVISTVTVVSSDPAFATFSCHRRNEGCCGQAIRGPRRGPRCSDRRPRPRVGRLASRDYTDLARRTPCTLCLLLVLLLLERPTSFSSLTTRRIRF